MYIYSLPNSPKMLQETLSFCQSLVGNSGDLRLDEHIQRLQDVINECQRMRPTGLGGKHGDRHTQQCGCDDKQTEPERREFWDYLYGNLSRES